MASPTVFIRRATALDRRNGRRFPRRSVKTTAPELRLRVDRVARCPRRAAISTSAGWSLITGSEPVGIGAITPRSTPPFGLFGLPPTAIKPSHGRRGQSSAGGDQRDAVGAGTLCGSQSRCPKAGSSRVAADAPEDHRRFRAVGRRTHRARIVVDPTTAAELPTPVSGGRLSAGAVPSSAAATGAARRAAGRSGDPPGRCSWPAGARRVRTPPATGCAPAIWALPGRWHSRHHGRLPTRMRDPGGAPLPAGHRGHGGERH